MAVKSLILSDIHGNLAALEAVLDAEGSWDEVLFLGDTVIGGPQPNEVLDILRSLSGIFLLGNHDSQALNTDLHERFTDPHKLWCQWIRRVLTPENLRFIESLADTQAITRAAIDIRLIHGQLPKDYDHNCRDRYIWPDTPEESLAPFLEQYDESVVLHGHSHVQYRRRIGNQELINPGGLGQPRLGQPLACYAVLTDGQIDLRAVPYDFEKTAAAMALLDLDADFIAMWQKIYRDAALAPRYQSRDLGPLLNAGYR